MNHDINDKSSTGGQSTHGVATVRLSSALLRESGVLLLFIFCGFPAFADGLASGCVCVRACARVLVVYELSVLECTCAGSCTVL